MSQQNMRHAAVEHEALRHIIGTCEPCWNGSPHPTTAPVKLSSLRFITQSFQRHLERLMALKEQDGYMSDAVEQMPSLADKEQTLLREHDEFEESLHRLVLKLEHVSASDRRENGRGLPRFGRTARKARRPSPSGSGIDARSLPTRQRRTRLKPHGASPPCCGLGFLRGRFR